MVMPQFKVIVRDYYDNGVDVYERHIEALDVYHAIWKMAKEINVSEPDEFHVEQVIPVAESDNKVGSNKLCLSCQHPISKHNDGLHHPGTACYWKDENEEGTIVCSCRKFT